MSSKSSSIDLHRLLARRNFMFLISLTCLSLFLVTRHLLLPNTSYDSYRISSSESTSTTNIGQIPLRIMCLGASVVRGDVSIGNVGFRKELRERLVYAGHPVNMVGLEGVGDMKDNDVDARSGSRVGQVHFWATQSVPKMKPNLFILNVGSNDCLQKFKTDTYHIRLRDLMNFLLEESPRGAIVLSTLLTNTVSPLTEVCILDLNAQMRNVYEEFREQGKPVVLAEMHDNFVPGGDELERPHVSNITPDGTHPDDEGYSMMAKILLQGIEEVKVQGFLKSPQKMRCVMDDGDEEKDIDAALEAVMS